MAHIVGGGGGAGSGGGSVLKREPCQKCNLPVFLAERLVLGKKLFHRTCLKCARCQSQLTPGSFYETEVDSEFCCETCPDEEKEFALKKRLKSDVPVHDDVNKSFTEKLAMFQTDGKGLLQKSLSDEEKSKSLKRLTEFYSSQEQTYKANTALSSFINNQVDTDQSVTSTSSIKSDDSSSSSDEESEENEDPPDLPTTKPPFPLPLPAVCDNVIDQTTSPDTTSQLNLTMEIENNNNNNSESQNESPPNRSSSTINIISDNIPLHDDKMMPADAFYELSNVTKEESKHETEYAVDCVPQVRNKNVCGPAVNSMVKYRLSQFETKIGADQQIASKNVSKELDVSEIGECHNVSHIQANEIEVPAADQIIKLISSDVISDIRKYKDEKMNENEIFEKNVKCETDNCQDEVQTKTEVNESDDVELTETAECVRSENKEITETNAIENELDNRSEKEIELDEIRCNELTAPIDSNSSEAKDIELVVPVPRKRASKTPQDDETAAKPVPVKRGVKSKKANNQKVAEQNSTLAKDVNAYPLDLNPFGSDDEGDTDDISTNEVGKTIVKKPAAISCNPFDSSDDEVELEKDNAKKYSTTKDLSKSR